MPMRGETLYRPIPPASDGPPPRLHPTALREPLPWSDQDNSTWVDCGVQFRPDEAFDPRPDTVYNGPGTLGMVVGTQPACLINWDEFKAAFIMDINGDTTHIKPRAFFGAYQDAPPVIGQYVIVGPITKDRHGKDTLSWASYARGDEDALFKRFPFHSNSEKLPDNWQERYYAQSLFTLGRVIRHDQQGTSAVLKGRTDPRDEHSYREMLIIHSSCLHFYKGRLPEVGEHVIYIPYYAPPGLGRAHSKWRATCVAPYDRRYMWEPLCRPFPGFDKALLPHCRR